MNLLTTLLASLALSLFILVAGPGHASESSANTQPVEKWYKVEVIIFSQRDVFADELPSRNITMSYPTNLIDLEDNTAGFSALPDSQRELGPDAYSLNRTGVYQVVFHKAWQQPGLAPATAPWIDIDIAKDNTAINGSLRVYLSSYLHMESNIWQVNYAINMGAKNPQRVDNTALTTQGSLQNQSGTNLSQLAPALWPQPPISPVALSKISTEEQVIHSVPNLTQRHIDEINLLKQESRIKLNKLHYFDHPKMGLLFKVTRSKAPAIK